MSFEFLAKKLNIHGVTPRDIPGGGSDGDTLTREDVHGALGLGRLTLTAYFVGMAVHTRDRHAELSAWKLGEKATIGLFRGHNWSALKPYRQRFGDLVRGGELSQDSADRLKRTLAEALPRCLARLALDELMGTYICPGCGGTGYFEGQPHDACRGSGRHPASDGYRASFCYITPSSWSRTWKYRYGTVLALHRAWLNEFEVHLQEKS